MRNLIEKYDIKLSDGPMWKHHCDECTFYGNMKWEDNIFDLYYHFFEGHDLFTVRYGNNLEDYDSCRGNLTVKKLCWKPMQVLINLHYEKEFNNAD